MSTEYMKVHFPFVKIDLSSIHTKSELIIKFKFGICHVHKCPNKNVPTYLKCHSKTKTNYF